MDSKAEFLRSLPIFDNLEEEELVALARIAPEYEFETGAVLAYQGDAANSLYIVCSGRLFASKMDERGIVRERQVFEAKDYFGENWLFKEGQHEATVRATESGRLLIIKGPDLIQLLQDDRQMVDGFAPQQEGDTHTGLSEEAWKELSEQIEGIDLEKERVVFQTRRSVWVVFFNTIIRLSILTIWVLGYLWLATIFTGLMNTVMLFFLFLIPVTFLIFWLGLTFLDWYNDYFLLTPRQVYHYEFTLDPTNFGRKVQRTPLEQIQSVNVERPNIVLSILNVGTVRLTTGASGGTGVVEFDKLPRPDRVREILDEQLSAAQEDVQLINVSRTQSTIRQAVEGHFHVPSPYKIIEDEEGSETDAQATGRSITRIGAGLSARVESGATITYRKSRVFLILNMKWGLLLLFFIIISGLLFSRYDTSSGLWAMWSIVLAITLFILLYKYLDWVNDQYQLTDRYVIDIDKLPFGLSSSQTQAELVNIQNVTTQQSGIPAYIFNYGNVIIETAGASADIEFERVTHPRQIQQEIFARRDQQRQRRARRDEEKRLREFAMMLDVYQQLKEQEHIPQRTMTPDQVTTQSLNRPN